MGNAPVSKTEFFDVKYKYGCCSAVNAGFYVNEQVQNPVRTTNGIYVELSPNALAQVQAKLQETKGEPVRVQMKVPCCGGACCGGGGCACLMACDDPLDARGVYFDEVWFETKSTESMCSGMVGCLANRACARLPFTLSIMCVPTVSILPQEMNGIDPAIRFGGANMPGGMAGMHSLEGLKNSGRPPTGQYNFPAPTLIASAHQPAMQTMQ